MPMAAYRHTDGIWTSISLTNKCRPLAFEHNRLFMGDIFELQIETFASGYSSPRLNPTGRPTRGWESKYNLFCVCSVHVGLEQNAKDGPPVRGCVLTLCHWYVSHPLLMAHYSGQPLATSFYIHVANPKICRTEKYSRAIRPRWRRCERIVM